MRPAGFLIDLDGTVYQAGRAIPGAAAALDELRRRGVPFLFDHRPDYGEQSFR